MNPAPDADLHSVGKANFEWIVREVADLAIAKAKSAPAIPELRWAAFLGSESKAATEVKNPAAKPAAKKKTSKASAQAKG